MTHDPTDTPEPTAEEWSLARAYADEWWTGGASEEEAELHECLRVDIARILARHRVRVQRETVGRARVACGAVFAEFADAARNAPDERTKAAKLEGAGAAAVCDTRIATLSTDAPESLEALLARVRERDGWSQPGLEEVEPGVWEACVDDWPKPEHLRTRVAKGPTPHAALRALLAEETQDDE